MDQLLGLRSTYFLRPSRRVQPPPRLLVLCLLLALVSAVARGVDEEASSSAPPPTEPPQHIVARYPGSDDDQLTVYADYNTTREDSLRFNHLLLEPASGNLLVGAVNRLVQLDADLRPLQLVITGPRHDNPQCHATGCSSPEVDTQLTDNVNKLLLATDDGSLLVCGSLFQGACERRNLSSIQQLLQNFTFGVAANDEQSSTFAFVGPQRYDTWHEPNVLYVGTTFTNNGQYRDYVPAISSRRLDTLELAEDTFTKQSQLFIEVKDRDHFLVKYVYGFNASNYAYFVVVQKQSYLPELEELGYVSRLARSCITDANYDSYAEVTLQCDVDTRNESYRLVQDAKIIPASADLAAQLGISIGSYVFVAAFSPSKGITNEPLPRSALCLYSLQEIDLKFNENIHVCFNSSVKHRNMGYISGQVQNGECPQSTGNIGDFCEEALKISGASPIVGQAILHFPDTLVTSIALANTESHTVAFLGTEDGAIKKVLISALETSVYESIVVDRGHKILPDTAIAPQGDYLYVLSTGHLSKVRVQHCSSYTNCNGCLVAGDPYCGWCSLEKRCTVRRDCQKANRSSPRWLSLGTGQQCIDFEQVLPDRIPIKQMTKVQLTIRTLPELPVGAKYKCVFGNAEPIDAIMTPYGLSCPTPPIHSRPSILKDADHVLVPLSVRSSETNKDFVSRNFAYFDCARHTICSECVKAQWTCSWCIYDNKCTHNTTECKGDIVSAENSIGQASLAARGAQYCPRFVQRAKRIMLPNNVPKEISLEVENLPHPLAGHTGFQCFVKIESAHLRVTARVDRSRYIVCDKTVYSYEAQSGEYEAEVMVMWNNNHYVDRTTIVLYKCEVLGSHREHADCSLCVTRERHFECTWCGNSCVYRHSCLSAPFAECPKPRIDMIKPLSGPIEGGTLVTIEGSNLGLRESDVDGKIFIGNASCSLVDYEISVRIVCRTSRHEATDAAPVIVGNVAGYTRSAVYFSYKDIRLTGLYPGVGPQSGGTRLAITGQYLNIGSAISAYLDELPCQVNATQASSTRLTCVSSRAGRMRRISRLTLSIDGANRTLHGDPYNYTHDPTIMEIKPLSSFASGGRMITVHGTNLDTIQRPEMVVYLDKDAEPINRTVCSVLNPTQMECPSPSVASRFHHREKRSLARKDSSLMLKIGFLMDNVDSVRDLDKQPLGPRNRLVYVEDPKFFSFPDGIKLYKGDTLVIEGESLNYASDESDVNVTVGTELCNVTSLALTQLVCTPPEYQPLGSDELGSRTERGLPLVVVRVGRSLRFPIGYLQYDVIKSYSIPPEAVAGIAATTVGLVLTFVLVLVIYRRKSTQAEREYKRIQIQMDTLESNVRMECKQAFAELQTDMTDLTADLVSSGIPTLDHKNYIMKVFFPGVIDHPILNDPRCRNNALRTNYDAAMLQFEQLINNKCFVLTFIETLESQADFNIRDKVNVASLLMVVLMGKMEYATDILMSLLLRLIDKSVNSKHPQLMLRRTESVVEKMLTNWMALCMYNYLKDCAGSALFLLFQAIKHQIEKGPVDALSHDARYSLSEERLLREQIDHSAVTLHVVQDDMDEKHQCKVLDCDTISQVKCKILDALFKNLPFSQRPSVHEVDLEWRHGRGGHLTLQDEDLTTKCCGDWKRVNTLAHYGVKESAVMSLILRQNDAFSLGCKQSCPACGSSASLGKGGSALHLQHAAPPAPPAPPAHYPSRATRRLRCTTPPSPPSSPSPGHALVGPASVYSGGTGIYFDGQHSPPAIIANGDVESANASSQRLYHLVSRRWRTARTASGLGFPSGKLPPGLQPERTHKAIPEIFLTRLLSTKGTVQKFVDDFFNTILTANEALPSAVKWLFDLLDEAAVKHNILDPEVPHAWKSNSLPLRFWVNFIKNPDFMFDIDKSPTVDSSLSVIAQTFMDACSTSEHRLGKDSPSNKLLFAKDIPHYREKVGKFYAEVQRLPLITDQEMSSAMQQLSASHANEFDVIAALKELYIYVGKYYGEILEALETDPGCCKLHLANRLENVACTLEGEETSAC
ncbi:LOW QUALITY PROTEIN: plexin-B [Phymastichus coffea]|uniref:LOW QUALITY PROTEIN: plexin-B n=1 Tax=Phymastichus coffea TaxID=108790 RepID=UPI00273C5650|nr:LOW QUALITY PROTEIN: plexin-B [Phymastichus coffea]